MLSKVYKYLTNSSYRKKVHEVLELNRIKQKVRFTPSSASLSGLKLDFPDSASFCFIFDEIFNNEIYSFKPSRGKPLIIDAGANIGLSVLYFKKMYPDAEIIAFEPDDKIFDYLRKNIRNSGYDNIKLINKALWKEECKLYFESEGADGGKVIDAESSVINKIEINAVKLSNYLNRHVELLKMDIEGAEYEVLIEAEPFLHHVKNIFIEYHSFVNKTQKLDEILRILSKNGFRYNINNTAFSNKSPLFFRRIDYGMDLQLNIFAFRE